MDENQHNKMIEEDSTKISPNERGQWENKTEFILSLLGYAIGLGNIWRFPYLCYRNGGGAFLVPYLLMLFLCGIPLFFLETSIGQFASVGCTKLFKLCPLFKGAGFAMIVVNLIVCTYFNTICAYPLIFLVHCINYKLPWTDCNNPWNTKNCSDVREFSLSTLISPTATFSRLRTPSDEFFHYKILQISKEVDDIGNIVWPLFIANVISWVITYICIIRGIKSVGKVVYFTATFPFVLLSILFVRGVTLPGAWNGIKYYIIPEWEQLINVKVWADAAIQIFYSLGPGWGGIVNIASYNSFKNDGRLDAIIVPLANSGTSIFAGFVVFSVLGFLSHQTGEPVPSVATGGPGLVFITYPEAISLLSCPQLWAILFFFMLFLLGLDSLGGMYWLQLFDWYAASISVVLICLIEIVIVGWIYGIKKFKRDIEFMMEDQLPYFWIVSWKFVTPLLLLFIFIMVIVFNTRIMYHKNAYPDWIVTVGWLSSASSMVCIPIYVVYRLSYLENGTFLERIKSSLEDKNWGPANPYDKERWENFIQNKKLVTANHQQTEMDLKEKLEYN